MFNDTAIATFRGPWGVPIEIGSSLVMLLVVLLGLSGNPGIHTVTFIAVILGSILLHELGHAWGCLVQGVPVQSVMIYGGGGYCQPARAVTNYENELIVVMGPIVNAVLWAVASLALPYIANPLLSLVVWQIMVVNLFLLAMNLLPVQPLDGGKLFHLGLLRVLHPSSATRIAGLVGLVLAVLWLPGMFAVFWYFGIFLFFFPSIQQHWDMYRNG